MSWSIENSLMFPAPVSLRLLLICCLPRLQQWPSLPCLDVFPGLSSSIPQNHIPPWAMTALTLVWSCAEGKEGPEQAFGSGLGMQQYSHRKPDVVLESFNLFPLPCFRGKQVCVCSSQAESRFPITLLSVSLVFRPGKGIYFSTVRPRNWDTQYVVCTAHFPWKMYL